MLIILVAVFYYFISVHDIIDVKINEPERRFYHRTLGLTGSVIYRVPEL